jgi:formylglycine-generating enzyme required for sulfatase activity
MSEARSSKLELKVILPLVMLILPLGTMAQQRPTTKVFTVKGVQFKMVFVQGGTYTMGALPHDTLADADEVRHQVLVNNFYLGETEVTQELWEAVMPKNRSRHRGNGQWPVEYVTYDMCQEFISRLNALTGEHFRLPTEAEWEYAARGGLALSMYPWGGPYTRNHSGCFIANFKPLRGRYADDGAVRTIEVASYAPNEYGLYDMAGNVAEWTSNAFDESAYSYTHDLNPDYSYNALADDPPVLKRKVIRGGSWKDVGYYLQVGTRTYEYQDTAKSYIGFRCVRSYMGRGTMVEDWN